MKKVLITGIGGAIGVHVAQHLLEKTDWKLVGVDSFKADHKGYFDRIAEIEPHAELVKQGNIVSRLSMLTHDLTAPFTNREIEKLGKIDYIINLASRSDVQNSIDDPLPFVRNNTEIMLTMLELARVIKPTVFLHFSTDEVYGPTTKSSKGHAEWDPIIPSNPYSASKAMQEDLGIAWWRSFGVPLIITNTMNNFGEMQAPSKFPAMIQSSISKEETIKVHTNEEGESGTRYYIHSKNTADALLFILENIEPISHRAGEMDRPLRLNIVGDKQVSNEELVNVIATLMGKPAICTKVNFHDHNPGHDMHYGLDGTKLAALGWAPPLSFEESMKRTIAWQQAHPEWMK